MTIERAILLGLRYWALSFIGGIPNGGAKMTAVPGEPRGSPRMPHRPANKRCKMTDRPNYEA